VRFRCPECGKTITCYPDFALPHKHYSRQTVEGFSRVYVQDDQMTYEDAVMSDEGPRNVRIVVGAWRHPSIHRWISTLADLVRLYQDALIKSLHEEEFAALFENLSAIQVPEKKYKTRSRKDCLVRCRWFFKVAAFLKKSDFTEFAITSV
jgi:hypothetical protein